MAVRRSAPLPRAIEAPEPDAAKTARPTQAKPREGAGSASGLHAVDPAGRSYVTLLALRRVRTVDIVQAVQKGLPFEAFERFLTNTSLSSADAAMLVGIPLRTLSRRKLEARLQPDESDRLLRAARIFGRAIGLFEGDRDEARRWLARPQRALGGAVPLDLASTEVGALAVERLIDQLEQGVFV